MCRFSPFASIAFFVIVLCLASGCSSSSTAPVTVNGPLHKTVFPPVTGHQYIYTGFGIPANSDGGALPDPQNQYRTSWTVQTVAAQDTTQIFTIIDTTTIPALTPSTTVKTLTFVRDTIRGNVSMVVSLGPILRSFGITTTDTNHLIMLMRPSAALFGTWIAFDSSFSDTAGVPFELRYTGTVVDTERITDSTSLHLVDYVYHFRVVQNVIISGSLFQASVYSEFWLQNEVGPIEMLIAQDQENAGNFRVLSSKNF